MSNHVNLIIATPGHSVMVPYLNSLLATIPVLAENNISWTYTSHYASHVADAREVTLSGTRKNDPSNSMPLSGLVTYDKILWIDSDIAWEPEDVIKMYNSDYDIVTGAYLLADGQVVVYDELFGKSYTYEEVLEMNEPKKVFGAGMGFMMVKQGVFESLSRPWFQSVDGTTIYNNQKFTFPILGEDLSFCKRVNDAGYEVWFDPSIKLIHHKMMRLTWEGAVS